MTPKGLANGPKTIAESTWANLSVAGKSGLGREIYFLNISKGDYRNKPAIIIISRQHPPEVTGYLAMQSFVETIIKEGAHNGFLERFRIMVYPLMNPDGVESGALSP